MLTYLGKIISMNGQLLYLEDADADRVVENDITWGTIYDTFVIASYRAENIRNEDGTQINVETQCVETTDVPSDTTFQFVLEPAFYEAQN